jgi:hypothetical protein
METASVAGHEVARRCFPSRGQKLPFLIALGASWRNGIAWYQHACSSPEGMEDVSAIFSRRWNE